MVHGGAQSVSVVLIIDLIFAMCLLETRHSSRHWRFSSKLDRQGYCPVKNTHSYLNDIDTECLKEENHGRGSGIFNFHQNIISHHLFLIGLEPKF